MKAKTKTATQSQRLDTKVICGTLLGVRETKEEKIIFLTYISGFYFEILFCTVSKTIVNIDIVKDSSKLKLFSDNLDLSNLYQVIEARV